MQDDPQKQIVNWLVKIRLLKNQIDKLERLKEFTILAIATFLLKTQIVEFEIKQVLFTLNWHIHFYSTSKLIKRIVKTPRDLDNLTLRKLVGEFDQFVNKSDFSVRVKGKKSVRNQSLTTLDKLKKDLNKLVDKRDKFTHHLFDKGKGIKELNEDAIQGIELANNVLNLMENLEKEMKIYEEEND